MRGHSEGTLEQGWRVHFLYRIYVNLANYLQALDLVTQAQEETPSSPLERLEKNRVRMSDFFLVL